MNYEFTTNTFYMNFSQFLKLRRTIYWKLFFNFDDLQFLTITVILMAKNGKNQPVYPTFSKSVLKNRLESATLIYSH